MYKLTPIVDITPDKSNPRRKDPIRMELLKLSLRKLGFILPVMVARSGLIISGHQRTDAAKELGWDKVPVQAVDLSDREIAGMNIIANRTTNDFKALSTSASMLGQLDLSEIIEEARSAPDIDPSNWSVLSTRVRSVKGLAATVEDQYDKKAVVSAQNFTRRGIHIPIVLSESGKVVNGVYRLFAAREAGIDSLPVVTIPDELAELAGKFLNYLSMDFAVDARFKKVLRYSAYRRPQNNRGAVAKSYRFWANGNRTLPEKGGYTTEYWSTFRQVHGNRLLDFGAGLCNAAPFLRAKGFEVVDFEPYMIDKESGVSSPSPMLSKTRAREFLQAVANPEAEFDSIFLASVMNSIPLPQDRMCVLAIVHALCSLDTCVYGTCRDVSDSNYEYSGIRQANYFRFEALEPHVRLGDSIDNPKIQKFHSPDEFKAMARHFWNKCETYPGGNVFYWKVTAPKRVNHSVLGKALAFEFEALPYSDGTTMGLGREAAAAFSQRLGIAVPRYAAYDPSEPGEAQLIQ